MFEKGQLRGFAGLRKLATPIGLESGYRPGFPNGLLCSHGESAGRRVGGLSQGWGSFARIRPSPRIIVVYNR